jgi:hypothetical protein
MQLASWLARDVMPAAASRRGMVGAHLLQPAAPPPMTHEQELRGPDKAMPWLLIVSGYEAAALEQAVSKHLDHDVLRDKGASEQLGFGSYTLHYMSSALEVSKTVPLPVHKIRKSEGR